MAVSATLSAVVIDEAMLPVSDDPSPSMSWALGNRSTRRRLTGSLQMAPDDDTPARGRGPAVGVGVEGVEHRTGEGVAHDDDGVGPFPLEDVEEHLGVEAGRRHA